MGCFGEGAQMGRGALHAGTVRACCRRGNCRASTHDKWLTFFSFLPSCLKVLVCPTVEAPPSSSELHWQLRQEGGRAHCPSPADCQSYSGYRKLTCQLKGAEDPHPLPQWVTLFPPKTHSEYSPLLFQLFRTWSALFSVILEVHVRPGKPCFYALPQTWPGILPP